MQCPKCDGDMETVSEDTATSVRIDRCLECQGLYFDQLTRSDLLLMAGRQDLDSGDAEKGAEYDDMVYVECRKCDKIMDQRKIEAPAIRFETCPSCYSTFLDAGEFTQYLSTEFRGEFESLLPE